MNLLENVLAFTVLSLGLVVFVALLNSGYLLNRRSEAQIRAEQVLEELLELYCHDAPGLSDGNYVLPYRQDGVVSLQLNLRLSTYSNDPVVRQVQVTAVWPDGRRERRRLVCDVPR